MAGISKHKPKTWRENRGEEILKYRNEIAPKIVEKILKEEEEKLAKEAERTDHWVRKKKPKFKSNMPIIGSKKYPFDEKSGKVLAEDRGPKEDSILVDGKWIPIVEALRGTLVKKGIKLAYRLATKKYPQLFKKKKMSIAELKGKKIKTPELKVLGVEKTTANDLRKLAVAEVTKDRLTKLGNMAIKHQRKAVSLFWGKAKNFNQIEKLEKYHTLATKKKLESIGKQYADLSKYQETIKAKSATKHSEGGEVVIGKNVDKSLL
jgi:hypothetical protein